jgi:hypothetical protein
LKRPEVVEKGRRGAIYILWRQVYSQEGYTKQGYLHSCISFADKCGKDLGSGKVDAHENFEFIPKRWIWNFFEHGDMPHTFPSYKYTVNIYHWYANSSTPSVSDKGFKGLNHVFGVLLDSVGTITILV